ncbi:hypothetical protein [Bremerella alba]|uniref:Ribonuclease D n=1 Tax=Bremerella alba TaxID=980252 RepID=A0A7V8V882_9BACT|nr:hypothetical protein [Bremerella alba]MBA2116774.1 Ribonuclease D [Bremerella alba]
MEFRICDGDLDPDVFEAISQETIVACDSETSGLDWRTEEIGLIQLYTEKSGPILLRPSGVIPIRFIELLEMDSTRKLFHHAMFDLRFIANRWTCSPMNISCTKVLAKLAHPGDKNSLKELLDCYCNIIISKKMQVSDWTSEDLTGDQLEYAISDVYYLPLLEKKLLEKLRNEHLFELAQKCCDHIPTRLKLDLGGYPDVFAY